MDETKNVEDWESFYSRFHNDSLFQISRIHDSVKAVSIDGEEIEKYSKNNWVMLKNTVYEIDTSKYKFELEVDSTSAHERIYVENSGFDINIYFELIDKKWYLVKYIDQNL